MLQVSQNAEDLVVSEEVSSRATYEKKYRRPEWPQGASGITAGIGYDTGYTTRDRIASDWMELPNEMVAALQSVAGLKGESAHAALPSVKSKVDIPFDQAMHVFDNLDKPRYLNMLDRAVPNCAKLDPNAVGALWSLVYNRGASFSNEGDRFREMRAIKLHMINEEFDKIPGEIRSMKRLWNNGLVGRREREAKLFERGLAIMSGQHIETTAPRVATRTEQVQRTAAATATATSATTGTATGIAPPVKDHSYMPAFVGVAIVIGFVVAFGAVTYIGRHKLLGKADPVSTEEAG